MTKPKVLVALAPWGQVVDPEEQGLQITTHEPSQCAGENCVIHNPSDHHMKDWPMVVRMDKSALVERTCPHGVGHPDPDSAAFFERVGKGWVNVHGCCQQRCCQGEESP